MSTIPAVPAPASPPRPAPTGPAGARPAGPAGVRPTGAAGVRPRASAADRGAAPSAAYRKHLATAFVDLFLEVEAGCRPPRHLAPLLAPMLYARLCRVWYRGGQPGRVVSVSVIGTEPDAFDAVAVVRRGARSGAVSLRLTRTAGRWRVAELARPEDGPLPGPAYRVALDADQDDDDAEIPAVILRGGVPANRAPVHDWLLPAPAG